MSKPIRGKWTLSRRATVAAIGVAAAVGALLADGAPTGTDGVDPLFRALLALLAVLAATQARPWTVVVMATGAAASAATPETAALGAAALLAAGLGAWDESRAWWAPALGVALGLQSLLRLDWADPHGASALVVALLVVPLFLSALLAAPRRVRRLVGLGMVALGLSVAVVAVGLGVATFQARDDVGNAIAVTNAGFAAAESGDEDRAVALFEAATADFESAAEHLSVPFIDAAKLVPVMAQHARAIEVLTDAGADLTATAAEATRDAPLDELGAKDGRIDLDQVAQFIDPVDRAAASLRKAERAAEEVESDWFLGPMADKVDDFAAEVADVLPDAELAARGLEVAPALLGGEGTRSYFVLFVNPAESRGLGGFVGSYGVIEADNGALELTTSNGIETLEALTRAADAEVTRPADYVERYGRYEPAKFPGDLTLSPDMPSVATAVDDVLRQSVGSGVDGVIAVDPVALAALLTFTGPIAVDGVPVALTADNAAEFLLREQYLLFTPEDPGRKDFLADVSRETFERLTDGDLPGPSELSRVLDPVVDQGRLSVHAFDDDEQRFFELIGADKRFPTADDGDLIGLVTQNSGNSKIDTFLTRELHYDAVFDPSTGEVRATATVSLTNDAPSAGLPNYVIGSTKRPGRPRLPNGTNWSYVSLYSSLGLDGAAIDGVPLPVEREQELGSNVYSARIVVPAGATVAVTYELNGTVATGLGYRLTIPGQPLVNDDLVDVRIDGAPGWELRPGPGFERRDGGVGVEYTGPVDTRLAAIAQRSG